jgi:splicing factor 3B subunit 2
MGLSTAERNRRKRERTKQRKLEEQKVKQEEEQNDEETTTAENVEIEYVPEPVMPPAGADFDALRRFQERATAAVISDDERQNAEKNNEEDDNEDDEDEFDEDGNPKNPVSKRKLREMIRPSVADLKRTVERPDLVEAHDVTSADPAFLIRLKSVPGTVPVPRHWGWKRKYLQGKVRHTTAAYEGKIQRARRIESTHTASLLLLS